MESNLEFYNKVKSIDERFTKKITGGRLKGMTDIKPQYRILKLTEMFGMCGFGWYYDVVNKFIEEGENNEKIAIVEIHLFVKYNDEWSKPIYGLGGSMFTTKERNGIYTSDECFKMALTDALSVSCKQIGIASDVYMGYSDSKYISHNNNEEDEKPWLNKGTEQFTKVVEAMKNGYTIEQVRSKYKVSKEVEKLLLTDK